MSNKDGRKLVYDFLLSENIDHVKLCIKDLELLKKEGAVKKVYDADVAYDVYNNIFLDIYRLNMDKFIIDNFKKFDISKIN